MTKNNIEQIEASTYAPKPNHLGESMAGLVLLKLVLQNMRRLSKPERQTYKDHKIDTKH